MCFLFATLYSDCQVFSGLAIKWLLASRMSYKAPANGEKGRLCFQTFVPETVLRLLSPGETNASDVIQKNDFRFSVSSNIWTGLLKWLKGPLIRQILGKEILDLQYLDIFWLSLVLWVVSHFLTEILDLWPCPSCHPSVVAMSCHWK